MIHRNHPSLAFSKRHNQGFTLVEMLTVVGIVALLIALATPALVDVIRSTRLSSAGDSLLNRMTLAQQEAIARSREVEMRFYKYPNADTDRPTQPFFYAYQVVETPSGADARAISEPYYIESGIVLADKREVSPLLQTTLAQQKQPRSDNFIFSPGNGISPDSVQYAAMRFYPDGSCRMLNQDDPDSLTTESGAAMAYITPTLDKSFFTLVEWQDVMLPTIPPKNFYCIQIDAYTGKARVYRP